MDAMHAAVDEEEVVEVPAVRVHDATLVDKVVRLYANRGLVCSRESASGLLTALALRHGLTGDPSHTQCQTWD